MGSGWWTTEDRPTKYRAYCHECQWSFTVEVEAVAERLKVMHNHENCPNAAARVDEMTVVIAPPEERSNRGRDRTRSQSRSRRAGGEE